MNDPISLEFGRIITNAAPAALTAPDAATIHAAIADMARTIEHARPRPARFECGDQVRDMFLSLAIYPTSRPPADRIWGIPVQVRVDLDPCAWRLLDTDGQVLKEGTVRRP